MRIIDIEQPVLRRAAVVAFTGSVVVPVMLVLSICTMTLFPVVGVAIGLVELAIEHWHDHWRVLKREVIKMRAVVVAAWRGKTDG